MTDEIPGGDGDMVTFFCLTGGLALLVVGAEALVCGASGLAGRLGIPTLIVGLTVVAFGTSAPELAVSVTGALGGRPELAFGNVIGSNIFNLAGVLGLTAAVSPSGLPVPEAAAASRRRSRFGAAADPAMRRAGAPA